MRKIVSGIVLLLCGLHMQAQNKVIKVPLQADHWDVPANAATFLTYKSVPALQITGKGQIVLKDLDFTNGTIEFDVELKDKSFASFYFRRASAEESELFYFRTGMAGKPDAIQYAPIVKNVNLWDLLPQYQRNANYTMGQWTHVRLVVSGKQLQAYVNEEKSTALQIPYLEGNTTHGGLAFEGPMTISNLVVKPNQRDGLSPLPGLDVTDNDPRFIRKWKISPMAPLGDKIDFNFALMPDSSTVWDTIRAERQGLINLTRKFGGGSVVPRRIVFLKTKIHSEEAQKKLLHLGFSDEVWVFINGTRPFYVDKNIYGSYGMKPPGGRLSIDNCSFEIPLLKGDNELMIAVENNFYGWGIDARFNDLDDISIEQ
jgi:hypothetical protein